MIFIVKDFRKTRLDKVRLRTLTIYRTSNERVPNISGETRAQRLMIDNRALSVLAAHAGARIGALVSYAHQIG